MAQVASASETPHVGVSAPQGAVGRSDTSSTAAGTATCSAAAPVASEASGPVKTTVSRFVNAVPKLERKHSSGDLHSRLKTRKVLGVGTTDNGDVHRSKISQVLGHNEHLYVRFPRGLLGWYLLVTCGLGLQGGLLLASPSWAAQLGVLNAQQSETDGLALLCRTHGVTLIGLSHLLYAVYGTSDKTIIRAGLGALVLIDACAITTQLASLTQSMGSSDRWWWLQLGWRGVSAAVSLAYLCLSRNHYPTTWKTLAPPVHSAAESETRKKSL